MTKRPGARGTETVTPAVRSDADASSDGSTVSVGPSLELPGLPVSVKSLGASTGDAEAEDPTLPGEPGAPFAPGEGARPLPQQPKAASKLDTSGKVPEDEQNPEVGGRVVKSRGGWKGAPTVQFELFGGRQWTLPLWGDGSSRLEPPAVDQRQPGDEQPDPELEDPRQVRLFDEGGVQMPFVPWRTQVSEYARRAAKAAGAGSKIGRRLFRMAAELAACGRWSEERSCTGCGTCETGIVSTCDVRPCPRCAAVRANGKRRALDRTLKTLKRERATYRRPDNGQLQAYQLRMLTLTARFDPTNPDDVTPAAYWERFCALKRALDRMFDEILSRDGAGGELGRAGIHFETEVSFGGLLHLHVTYWGRFLEGREEYYDGSDLEHMREILHLELGGSLHEFCTDPSKVRGNVQVELAYAKKRKDGRTTSAVHELVKYAVKASHPLKRTVGTCAEKAPSRWMDPALAAVVTIAFLGRQISGGRGTLRKINADGQVLEDHAGEKKDCDCGRGGTWQFRWIKTAFLRATQLDLVIGGPRRKGDELAGYAERQIDSARDAFLDRNRRWARRRARDGTEPEELELVSPTPAPAGVSSSLAAARPPSLFPRDD